MQLLLGRNSLLLSLRVAVTQPVCMKRRGRRADWKKKCEQGEMEEREREQCKPKKKRKEKDINNVKEKKASAAGDAFEGGWMGADESSFEDQATAKRGRRGEKEGWQAGLEKEMKLLLPSFFSCSLGHYHEMFTDEMPPLHLKSRDADAANDDATRSRRSNN